MRGKSKFEFFKKVTDALFSHFEVNQVCFCLLEEEQLQIKNPRLIHPDNWLTGVFYVIMTQLIIRAVSNRCLPRP